MKALGAALGGLSLLAAGYLVLRGGLFYFRPLDPQAAPQVVNIARGSGLGQIARQLEREGIVRRAFDFRLLGRLCGGGRGLKSGEYEFSAAMRPIEVLRALIEGKVLRHRFTIPEGYNLAQIAAALEIAGLADAGDFLRQARDCQWLKELQLPGTSLEGFLFPETYYFPRYLSPQRMQKEMVDNFFKAFSPDLQQQAKRRNLTLLQAVTLASIIEKESSHPQEQPLISAVFHNRLKKRMRLQADPTVIYGLSHFDGNLTKRHLQTPTPYNTYVIFGLPPGPIANPGLGALTAALNPAESRALYFVAKGDGTHVFTETLMEHNAQVGKFQRKDYSAKVSAVPAPAPQKRPPLKKPVPKQGSE